MVLPGFNPQEKKGKNEFVLFSLKTSFLGRSLQDRLLETSMVSILAVLSQ